MKYGNLYKFGIICIGIVLIVGLALEFVLPGNRAKNIAETVNSEVQPANTNTVDSTAVSDQGTDGAGTNIDDEDREMEFFWDMTYPEPEDSLLEEEILPEAFQPYEEEAIPGNYYFTNTEHTLDTEGVFSMYAQGTLVRSVKFWMFQQGLTGAELRCIEDSVITTDTDVSFSAECIENKQIIICTYTLDSHSWSFKTQ